MSTLHHVKNDTAEQAFAEKRLAYLAELGVPMVPGTVADRNHRPISFMERGHGTPVLFIHGGLSQAGEWGPLLPHLPSDWRTILVDRPGCGLTYKLDYSGVDYRQAADDFVADVLDAFDFPQVHLVGNSMGGFFSCAFALAHPERVSSLTLIGAPAGMVRRLPFPIRLMSTRFVNRLIFRAMSGETTPAALRKQVYQGLLVAHGARVSDASIDLGILANGLDGSLLASRTMLQCCAGLFGFRELIRDDMAALPTKTHFVWGDRDAFESCASGRRLAQSMPAAKFTEITEAGHLPWHDQPETCGLAVAAFIEGLRSC